MQKLALLQVGERDKGVVPDEMSDCPESLGQRRLSTQRLEPGQDISNLLDAKLAARQRLMKRHARKATHNANSPKRTSGFMPVAHTISLLQCRGRGIARPLGAPPLPGGRDSNAGR